MSDLVPLPAIGPLERINFPPELDGEAGTNRALGGRPQIDARNDVAAITAWLARVMNNPGTLASYRKEAERLLLWSVIERGKPLSSLTHEDVILYQRFLADPRPPERWIMAPGRKAARSDPDWRPFAGPLSATSQRQTMVILNSLFAWLVTAGYLAGNPLSLSRTRKPKAKPRITRFLEESVWQEVKETIAAMPRDADREREHAIRVRWLFSLLYMIGMRISEVTGNTMGNFRSRRDKQGEERWWLEITGKGDKTRDVPATQELMAELVNYRRENGLPPYPTPKENTPLLLPIGGKPRPLSRSGVHLIVKEVFARAGSRVRTRGTDDTTTRLAESIEIASAHWLRHTAGSHMADGDIDLRYIRDNLGHESLSTTSQYLHSEDDKRHQETEKKHRLGW